MILRYVYIHRCHHHRQIFVVKQVLQIMLLLGSLSASLLLPTRYCQHITFAIFHFLLLAYLPLFLL